MPDAEHVKPRSIYVEEAIQFALESRWPEALALNEALIERHGADEDVYNRIGKAQTELGHLEAALEAYAQALKLNPLNVIAQKNTHKLVGLVEARESVLRSNSAIDVDAFAEEPGKSTSTVLTPLAKRVKTTVVPGDTVQLEQVGSELHAQTGRGVVLGAVDTKLARRLIPLMQTGNRYSAAVARVDESGIEIIINEQFQSAANAGKTSFAVARGTRATEFRPYGKDSLLDHRGVHSGHVDDEGGDGFDSPESSGDSDLDGMQTTDDFDDDTAVAAGDDDAAELDDELEADDDDDDDDDE